MELHADKIDLPTGYVLYNGTTLNTEDLKKIVAYIFAGGAKSSFQGDLMLLRGKAFATRRAGPLTRTYAPLNPKPLDLLAGFLSSEDAEAVVEALLRPLRLSWGATGKTYRTFSYKGKRLTIYGDELGSSQEWHVVAHRATNRLGWVNFPKDALNGPVPRVRIDPKNTPDTSGLTQLVSQGQLEGVEVRLLALVERVQRELKEIENLRRRREALKKRAGR